MNIPLPTYGRCVNFYAIAEAVSMFADKIDTAIKTLTSEPKIGFASKRHLIQLVMYTAGLFMCEESFKDVERYLGDGAETILRDFGGRS